MIKRLLFIIALTGSLLTNLKAQPTFIESGNLGSFIICGDSVRSFGFGVNGQLGQGDEQNLSLPKTIKTLGGVIAVSSAGRHTLFLKSDGTVWACGDNAKGQLGNGLINTINSPVQVSGLTGVTAIFAGEYYSLFLKNDGTVWACGSNEYGQLGTGNTNNVNSPVQVPGLSNIIAISGGYNHSLFLENGGNVWACGNNNSGQLGNGTSGNQTTPVLVGGLTGITAISAGYDYSLFLKNNDIVWACGTNEFGQLGDGTTTLRNQPVQISGLSGITAISAAVEHSMFLKNDGTVWACGDAEGGELGDGTSSYFIRKKIPGQVNALTGITAISAGPGYNLFLKNDGTVWACGSNSFGCFGNGEQVGMATTAIQLPPVCVLPTPPQATVSVPNNAVCQGSNVTISCKIVGSNPDRLMVIDNSISLNNPIAIDKNSHAVFVLNNNNSVTAYNFDGSIYLNYPSLNLTNIWAFTVDDNDNLYINNGTTDGGGNLVIYKCDNTGARIDSIPNGFMNASNLVTDLLYYNDPAHTENMFYSDTLSGAAAVDATNMNDNSAFANSISFNIQNKHYTSLSMDNFYADKRLLMADPINNILQSTQLFNNTATAADTLVSPALTAGMAFDFISADTTLKTILVSSRTTGILGGVSSYRRPDGTVFSDIDTSGSSLINAIAPVGAVAVRKDNLLQFWIADNGQNKLLRVSIYSYQIIPALPAGLTFNSITGVIEGTPTVVTTPQTYTLTIYSPLGNSSSTFSLSVTPSSGVSNTPGTSTSQANQSDGTTKNYIDGQNCTKLAVITDFVGGTSPGTTHVEQTVSTANSVTVGNSNFVRRVTSVSAQQTENLNANITFYYTYQDIQAYNAANPTNTFTNDTLAGSMQIYILHMHETFDSINSVWHKEPTYYGPLSALWIPNEHVWSTGTNITKLSEFYAHPSSIATSFDCTNSGADTLVANDYYVWNYTDSLFTSGDYIDTLINQTGCDSIAKLHLTINSTAGLNEAASASGITVYPNPSSGIFNIHMGSALSMPTHVRVINVIGTEVLNKTITSSDAIDLSPYQSGVYYLIMENGGTTKTWRIVKQN